MKNTLAGQNNFAQGSMASNAHFMMHRTRPVEEHRIPHTPTASHHKKTNKAFNYTMHDCYERLKQLVPTIPKNKKITRVEILQHVIDYIQDLQSALETHNITVRRAPSQGQHRAPFASLTPQQNLDMLSGLADMEDCEWQRTLLNLTAASRGSKLHPYETPESSPEALPTCSSC